MLSVFHKVMVDSRRIRICETVCFSIYHKFWYSTTVLYFLKMNNKVNKKHISTQSIHQATQVGASDIQRKLCRQKTRKEKENVYFWISSRNVAKHLKYVQLVHFSANSSLCYTLCCVQPHYKIPPVPLHILSDHTTPHHLFIVALLPAQFTLRRLRHTNQFNQIQNYQEGKRVLHIIYLYLFHLPITVCIVSIDI